MLTISFQKERITGGLFHVRWYIFCRAVSLTIRRICLLLRESLAPSGSWPEPAILAGPSACPHHLNTRMHDAAPFHPAERSEPLSVTATMVYQPVTISAGQNPLVQCVSTSPYCFVSDLSDSCRFNGLITTFFLKEPAGTAFQIKQIYKPLPEGPAAQDVKGAYRGPPPHFHPNQTERFRVLKGSVGVEIDGQITVLHPEDGVAVCPAGRIHRFLVDVDDSHEDPTCHRLEVNGRSGVDNDDGELVLLVNATDGGTDFALDRVFLENWYGIRVDSFKYYGDNIDFIQKCAVRSERPASPYACIGRLLADDISLICIFRRSKAARTTFLSLALFPLGCPRTGPTGSAPSLVTGSRCLSVVGLAACWLQTLPSRVHDRLGVCPGEDAQHLVLPQESASCVHMPNAVAGP